MSGDARLVYFYHAFGMAFLRRCYHQILGPRRYLSQFADGLCRHCNARFHVNPHTTWQATKRYMQRANAFWACISFWPPHSQIRHLDLLFFLPGIMALAEAVVAVAVAAAAV
jgi:hypothetical protein